MAPSIRWSSRRGGRPWALAPMAGLALLLTASAAGAPRTTDTLRFTGLGAEPVQQTTETLRFTGRARGGTP